MQYTFEQRKKINNYYREQGLDIHSFTPEALDDFHVYDLDGIDGVDTFHCTPIERNIFNQIRGISVKFLPEYQIRKERGHVSNSKGCLEGAFKQT